LIISIFKPVKPKLNIMLNPQLKEIYVSSSPQKSFPKEYILIFLGAIISIASTISITLINGAIEKQRQVTKDKILFADELCKSIASRITVVGSLYNAKLDTDRVELKKWTNRIEALDTFMYARTYYYPSRLKILFSDEFATRFRDSVDTPFDKLETEIIYTDKKQLETINMKERWPKLDTAIHNFTRALYAEAFKNFKD